MQLYSEGNNYKLFQGDMLDLLEVIDENSIDAVLTDPPYELNFMGKGWDNSWIAFRKDTWEKCLKALKPWWYLLAFGGSRTHHRIACAIEDAGFEIRDCIMRLYGCYSEDTEVLTDSWYKLFKDIDKGNDRVLQWDSETNKLSWFKPTNFFEYDIDDELVNFKNRNTDQLITKNHRVYGIYKDSRKPKWDKYEVRYAWDIKKTTQIDLPLSWIMDWDITIKHPYLVGWWLTDAWKHKDWKACMFSQCKPQTLNKLREYLDECWAEYTEYVKEAKSPKHKNEHIFYVHWEIAEYLLSNYNDRELKRWMLDLTKEDKIKLLEWLMDWDGTQWEWRWYSKVFWSRKKERLDIFQSLCLSLGYRSHLWDWCVYFNVNKGTTQVQFYHKHSNIKYKGKVYCLETEKWAFVLRRNWKAFISGNSGFPKSMNLWKSIESKLLNGTANPKDFKDLDGEKVETWNWWISKMTKEQWARPSDYTEDKHLRVDKVNYKTELWKKYEGRWTCLKPSYESIIVARKPLEWSCTDNVIKYWVGGINIDECRVGDETIEYYPTNLNEAHGNKFWNGAYMPKDTSWEIISHQGRFPANTILTYWDDDREEVCWWFPNTKSTYNKDSKHETEIHRENADTLKYWYKTRIDSSSYNDEWSAARYFYCAKASKRDRDEGLDWFEAKTKVFNWQSNKSSEDMKDVEKRFTTVGRNSHPCVKPTSLMQYLVRLVTPNGWTVLDPFNWSGSTGKAVMYENKDRNKDYKYIWIELTEEYLPISKARIEYVINETNKWLFNTNEKQNETI